MSWQSLQANKYFCFRNNLELYSRYSDGFPFENILYLSFRVERAWINLWNKSLQIFVFKCHYDTSWKYALNLKYLVVVYSVFSFFLHPAELFAFSATPFSHESVVDVKLTQHERLLVLTVASKESYGSYLHYSGYVFCPIVKQFLIFVSAIPKANNYFPWGNISFIFPLAHLRTIIPMQMGTGCYWRQYRTHVSHAQSLVYSSSNNRIRNWLNLSIWNPSICFHYLETWRRGQNFQISWSLKNYNRIAWHIFDKKSSLF